MVAQIQGMKGSLDTLPFGAPNPDAPSELTQFAFLLGEWVCDVRVRNENGDVTRLSATWVGRYILNGYVIADEFRMSNTKGTLLMLGVNYRSYNREEKRWVMKWLDARASTWLDLGPPELGGVVVEDDSITFQTLFRPNEIHRITFSEITEEHFLWRADRSVDGGATWDKAVMVMDVHRVTGR